MYIDLSGNIYACCIPPIRLYAPICLYAPCTFIYPHTSVCPHISLYICLLSYVPNMSWDLGGTCTPHMSLGLLGDICTSVRNFSVCWYIHCISVHNSHASCPPSLWVASLLDWIPIYVCFAPCCCSFLCSFHYVSSFYYHGYDYYSSSDCCVFWYVISSLNGYHGPLLDEASNNTGQHDVNLPPLLTPRHSEGVFGLGNVPQQQPPSKMPPQAYANYAMGPTWIGFSFRAEPPTVLNIYMFDVCSDVCFLLSGAMPDAIFSKWGLSCWGLHHCNHLELTHGRHMYNVVTVIGSHQICTE